MARLPSAYDISRERAPQGSPGINAGKVDYGPAIAGAKAISGGIDSIAGAVKSVAADAMEVDDYETRKRLLDFKLQTEMALEEHKREMPVGGQGFAESWQQKYKRMADDFVGKRQALIPQSQRQKVDLALTQHDTVLGERAQRAQLAEVDRREVEGLEETLGKTRSAVEADPNRQEEMRGEGQKLIDMSRIPPADRYRLQKKYDKEIDKTAALSRIMSAKSSQDFDEFKKDLAPDIADRRASGDVSSTLTSGKAKAPAAGWAASDVRWQQLDPYQKAAAMALMEADRADPNDAKNALGAMINRAAKNGEDLGAHVSQKIYQPTIEPAQQQRLGSILGSAKFEQLTEWARRRASGQEADPVNGATHFLAHEPTMEALRAREPGKYRSWVQWTGYDANGGQYANVTHRDRSHAFLAPEGRFESPPPAEGEAGTGEGYAGRYRNLSLSERKAMWQEAETKQKRMADGLLNEIKEFQGNAALGKLPPENVLKDLEGRVVASGDPRVRAHYESTFGLAQLTAELAQKPPIVVESIAKRLESQYGETAMPEEQKRLEHVKKLADNMRKQTNEDALSYAHTRRVMVPVGEPGSEGAAFTEPVTVEQLGDMRAPETIVQLQRRAHTARRVGEYYGQPPQFFTKIERDHLSDVLRRGGAPMLQVLSNIYSAFGTDTPLAMKEISKNAPEVAILGKLMSEGGDPRLLEDASKGLKLRQDLGDKFISHVDKKLVEPDVQEATKTLAKTPGMIDPVIHATNAIYEYRHRQQGKDKFDQDLYKKTMSEVLGEITAPDGVKYGGVGKQGSGWWDGKWSTGVIVPNGLRQDSFDEMTRLVQEKDLHGLSKPYHGDGKPLTVDEVRRATWVYVGTGRYALQTGTESNGDPNYAVDPTNKNQPFILDVRPLLPGWKKARPDLFAPGG